MDIGVQSCVLQWLDCEPRWVIAKVREWLWQRWERHFVSWLLACMNSRTKGVISQSHSDSCIAPRSKKSTHPETRYKHTECTRRYLRLCLIVLGYCRHSGDGV